MLPLPRFLPVLLSIVAFACIEAHDPPVDPPPDEPMCVADFDACDLDDAESCCEGYCADRGDGTGTCLQRAPDGTPCVSENECESRVCEDAICGGPEAPDCRERAEACVTNDDCCHGTVCIEGVCDVLREDGEDCASDAQCRDGECNSGGFCGEEAPSCVPEGNECGRAFHGEDEALGCCEGLECRLFFYGIATCGRPQPPGAPCTYPGECASGLCLEGICRVAECADTGVECTYTHECCSGYCTGGHYVRGECAERLHAGEACFRHEQCHSRNCVDLVCS